VTASLPRPDGPRRTAPWIAGAVGVVVVLLIVVLATRVPSAAKPVPSPIVGKPVPELVGVTIDGQRFDIDDHRGKFVVVNFFATWCVPCIQEHPELVAFDEAHRARGDVVVVSVAFNDTEAAIRDFFARRGGDWPVIGGDTGSAVLDFGVSGVPESYVVSPGRQVVAKFIGVTQAGLDEVIADVSARGGFEPAPTGSTR
jgi:cytochrome c biogenesis protein CcmG/thiol:disulfide interchange protein DsbE